MKSQKIEYSKIANRIKCAIDTFRQHGNVIDFLDVGCGTGQLTIEIAKAWSRAHQYLRLSIAMEQFQFNLGGLGHRRLCRLFQSRAG